ncbi:hypothetical protein CW304_08100 [Bacillus sp. UFRGS-B20]|nr:hypothetical protein CW304_08100 [Bacillus sp. UFRGS-B20]
MLLLPPTRISLSMFVKARELKLLYSWSPSLNPSKFCRFHKAHAAYIQLLCMITSLNDVTSHSP